MNNKIIKLVGDDVPYISITESEYNHLVQCEQELLLLKQQKNAEIQSVISTQQQGLLMIEQLANDVKYPNTNWF